MGDKGAGRRLGARTGMLAAILAAGLPGVGQAGPIDPAIDPNKGSYVAYVANRPPVDVEARAAAQTVHVDFYRVLCGQALAAYGKNHPQPAPYDERAREAITLACYLAVWTDVHGEGLRRKACDYATDAMVAGCEDPLIWEIRNGYFWSLGSTGDEGGAMLLGKDAQLAYLSNYPSFFRLMACRVALENLVKCRAKPDGEKTFARVLQGMPTLVHWMADSYRAMIQDGWPDDLLCRHGNNLLSRLEDSREALPIFWKEIEEVISWERPDGPLGAELKGTFYIKWAWQARGVGWGSEVTPEGWKLFDERLASAREVLEGAWNQYPRQVDLARPMLTVELGQSRGREEMEKWFQRAGEADPERAEVYDVYSAKCWWLASRWNGEEGEAWRFGEACLKDGDWEHGLPLILVQAAKDAVPEDQENRYWKEPFWEKLDGVFAEYLKRYPDSVTQRTAYAKDAALGGHWKTAREQFEALGKDWDIDVISHDEYVRLSSDADRLGQ